MAALRKQRSLLLAPSPRVLPWGQECHCHQLLVGTTPNSLIPPWHPLSRGSLLPKSLPWAPRCSSRGLCRAWGCSLTLAPCRGSAQTPEQDGAVNPSLGHVSESSVKAFLPPEVLPKGFEWNIPAAAPAHGCGSSGDPAASGLAPDLWWEQALCPPQPQGKLSNCFSSSSKEKFIQLLVRFHVYGDVTHTQRNCRVVSGKACSWPGPGERGEEPQAPPNTLLPLHFQQSRAWGTKG